MEFFADYDNILNMAGGPFEEAKFRFRQLHFHWGSTDEQGSEHQIDGKRYEDTDDIYVTYNPCMRLENFLQST